MSSVVLGGVRGAAQERGWQTSAPDIVTVITTAGLTAAIAVSRRRYYARKKQADAGLAPGWANESADTGQAEGEGHEGNAGNGSTGGTSGPRPAEPGVGAADGAQRVVVRSSKPIAAAGALVLAFFGWMPIFAIADPSSGSAVGRLSLFLVGVVPTVLGAVFMLHVRRHRTIASADGIAGVWLPRPPEIRPRYGHRVFQTSPIPWAEVAGFDIVDLGGNGGQSFLVFVELSDGRKAQVNGLSWGPRWAERVVAQLDAIRAAA